MIPAPMRRRVDIRQLLSDPEARKLLVVRAIRFIQATAGIETSTEQAEQAYDRAVRPKPTKEM